MTVRPGQNLFHLPRGRVASLLDAKGASVRVLRGRLWITQEGDARDVIVEEGEGFTIARDGITVLHALKRTEGAVEGIPVRRRPVSRWKALAQVASGCFASLGMNRAVTRGIYRL